MSKQGEKVNKSMVLSLDNLRQKHQETFTMSEAYVMLDEEYLSYKVYDRLPQTKENEFVAEMVAFAYEAYEDENKYGKLEEVITPFSLILAIEKFTDIEIPEDNEEKLIYAGYLADFGILGDILNTIDQEKVAKMMDEVRRTMSAQTEKLAKLMEQYQSDSGEIEDLSALRLVEKELEEDEK